jgi:undecaprenyl-diphosphatase
LILGIENLTQYLWTQRECFARIRHVSLIQIAILAVVQGFAELLPVSSSAHVVVAEKLLGLDPSSPPMTLLLVMLHSGTMIAVIVYFWRRWKNTYFQNVATLKKFAQQVVIATILTAVVGEGLIKLIEKTIFHSAPQAEIEIEDLFSHLEIIAPALAIAGLLILVAGLEERRSNKLRGDTEVNSRQGCVIGAVQGLCLPFRGFSRSGATISAGMLAGVAKARAENFSFALAVVLTPPVVGREILRLVHFKSNGPANGLSSAILFGLLGAVLAFIAGLLALHWLSRWLEAGRWYLFGVYCLTAAGIVETLHYKGY